MYKRQPEYRCFYKNPVSRQIYRGTRPDRVHAKGIGGRIPKYRIDAIFFRYIRGEDKIRLQARSFYPVSYTHLDQALRTDSDLVFGDLRQFRKGKSASYYNLDPVRVQDIDCDGNALLDEFMKLHGLCSSYHSFWNKLIRLDLWELCRKDFDFESEYAWKKCAASDRCV